MKSVDVTAGTIEYREEGDPSGPPVVLLHGLLMNDAQWNLARAQDPQARDVVEQAYEAAKAQLFEVESLTHAVVNRER